MLLRNFILVVTAVGSAYGADDVCKLFPKLAELDGKAVAASGELLVSADALAITGLCSEPFKVFLTSTPALGIEIAPSASAETQALIARAQEAARSADARGTFIRATATVEGQLKYGPVKSGGAQFIETTLPATLVATAISELKWREEPKAEDVPVISVCDLFRDLASYRGKRVAVRGRYATTGEGLWLLAEPGCPYSFETQRFLWGHDLAFGGVVSAADFSGHSLHSELPRIPRRGEPGFEAGRVLIVTVVGTILTRENYYVRCRFGQLEAIGFGHLGGSAASITPDAVLDPIVETRQNESYAPVPATRCQDP